MSVCLSVCPSVCLCQLIPTWIGLREMRGLSVHIRLFFQSHKNRGGPVVGGKDSDGPWLDSHGSIPNIFFYFIYFFRLAKVSYCHQDTGASFFFTY